MSETTTAVATPVSEIVKPADNTGKEISAAGTATGAKFRLPRIVTSAKVPRVVALAGLAHLLRYIGGKM